MSVLQALKREVKEEAMRFFESNLYRPPSRQDSEYIRNFYEFMGAARNSLESVLLKILPTAQSKVPERYVQLVLDAHAPTLANENGLLTGHSGGALAKESVETARSFYKKDLEPSIVISSDLPRALDHAIVKYYSDLPELAALRKLVPDGLDSNNGILRPRDQLQWLWFALTKNIIPTPLLRAQFYGPMELFPEKFDEAKVLDALGKYAHCLLGLSPEKMKQAIEQRKDAHATIINNIQLTENRENLMTRVGYLFGLFAPDSPVHELARGKRIQLVSHSGVHDVIFEQLRHIDKREEVHLRKRPKPKQRGESITVWLEGNTHLYLNDPDYFSAALQTTDERIGYSFGASLDQEVNKGNVLDTQLVAWQRQEAQGQDKYRAVSVSIYDELDKEEKILLLGDPGQGKTIFSARLAQKLKDSAAKTYVPILVSLRRLSEKLDDEVKAGRNADEDSVLEQILGKRLHDFLQKEEELVKPLLEEYTPVFILEGYDELSSDYSKVIPSSIDRLAKLGSVIVTSRFSGFDKYENRVYKTLNIDPNFAMATIDEYLQPRISDEEQRKRFVEFLKTYDTSVTTNSLMIFFLTRLYKNGELDLDHPPNSSQIYDSVARSVLTEHEYKRGAHWSQKDSAVIVEEKMKTLGEVAAVMTIFGKKFTFEELLSGKYKEWVDKLYKG